MARPFGWHPDAVKIANTYQWGKVAHECPDLYPSQELYHLYKAGKISASDMEVRYRAETLSKLDPLNVYRKLPANAILLCHEKPPKFCHRHVVAAWFNEKLKVEVEEIG
jgi:hypothetical protein